MSWRLGFVGAGLFVLLVLWARYEGQRCGIWLDWPLEEGVDTFFCEHSYMEDLVRQPFNTLSNFPFFLFGCMLLTWRPPAQGHNLLSHHPVYVRLYALFCLLVALGSTFFHASLIMPAQQFDMAGVNAMTLFPLSYNGHRLWQRYRHGDQTKAASLNSLYLFTGFFALSTLVLSLLKWQLNAVLVIGLLSLCNALTTIALAWRSPHPAFSPYLWGAALLLLGSGSFYILDMKKVFCDEYSWFQPHSVWHIGAGGSAWLFFRYIESEGKLENG